jgi:ribonuclease Y
MQDSLWIIALLALVLLPGAFVVGYWFQTIVQRKKTQAAAAESQRLLEDAETKRKEILLEAQDEALRLKTEAEGELRERRLELTRIERRLQQREEMLERRQEGVERREKQLAQQERELEQQMTVLEELKQKQVGELERIAHMTTEEAKQALAAAIEAEVRAECERVIRQMEEEAKEEAERRARRVIAVAIQRLAADHTVETTVSVVPLPNDEMKGRIIGREGRNIRALELLTGVDLIIDDTPEAVVLSAHDPVRREIARIALLWLIEDGRIHPARIEEMVMKAKQEVERSICEEGERAAEVARVHGLPTELLRLMGRLRYRSSFGQNVLAHSVEVAQLASIMASEISADVQVARRAAFLHDIGKAVDADMEGPHALVGAEIARRYGLSPKIVHAIAAHHNEEVPQTVEAFLVSAADAISASRPGARRDSIERYVQRLRALEQVANSFSGVEKSYAIQAGREVRILVRPDEIDELGCLRLTRDICKRIEETLDYPGQIKVTVIRETRVVDYAR